MVNADISGLIGNQYIVTDLTKPLPGNSFVSMFKRATIEEYHRY
jgi:hypothetical protein